MDETPPSNRAIDDSPSTPIRTRRAVRARRKRRVTITEEDEELSPPSSLGVVDFSIIDDKTMLKIAINGLEREELLEQADQDLFNENMEKLRALSLEFDRDSWMYKQPYLHSKYPF